MQRSIRLRQWQKEALDAFEHAGARDFLAVATPGAGKTTFALTAAARHLHANAGHRVVVVAPTAHLKLQWSEAGARLGLELETLWSAGDGAFPDDMHGVVVTYQQVAANPYALAAAAPTSFVVLDEIHHAGDSKAWGDSVVKAFTEAPRRLALSGTPFRSDTQAIPFVRYRIEEAEADYEYGYGKALTDGRVVRPVFFPRVNGFMEWLAPDGSLRSATFDDPLDATGSSQRLRTALSPTGEWLPTVLGQAHQQLLTLRAAQPDAGGLVIATDQDHARAIADVLRARTGVHPTLALSDDPNASDRIAHFAGGTQPWIVAVRMVSEGVDIPRLRIGVYATTTATELFFRQAVGRLVRFTGVARQRAFLFIPDDVRLRTYAAQIADQRRHSLRKPAEDDGRALDDDLVPDPTALDEIPPEQLTLFMPLSSVVTEASVFDLDDEGDEHEAHGDDDSVQLGLDIDMAPPPLPGGGSGGGGNRRVTKQALRQRNAELATELARFTGLTHAQVNGRLNREVGVARVTEATVDQLARRAERAERWLAGL